MTNLPFIKMQGLGNDYVFIDCISSSVLSGVEKGDLSSLTRRISDRHFGIGSDGLVLIMPSEKADVKMRMFNADGTEAQMCGNASRCIAKYVFESGICKKEFISLETLAGIRKLALNVLDGIVDNISVYMGIPEAKDDTLVVNGRNMNFVSVNMGNPHAVFFVDDALTHLPIEQNGPIIEKHTHFTEGTNVEFIHIINKSELEMRVWERGTGETFACGTGACAAVVSSILHAKTGRKVCVHLRGGDLHIQWNSNSSEVVMTGPAEEVFRGNYNL